MLSLIKFLNELKSEEKANNTIIRYKSDVKQFLEIVGDGRITDEKLAHYKTVLIGKYEPSTVNAKIMTINSFLSRSGIAKSIRLLNIKKSFFIDNDVLLTTEEINKLQKYCRNHNNYRMYYLIETYIKTGIRVSEHEFITVSAVNKGVAVVENKGSIRKVFIPKSLKKQLQGYIEAEGITEGPIFITRNENPVDRRNIWSELQAIGAKLGIKKEKLHAHNFRHYFARTNYMQSKDLVKLAAMLGHSSIETTRNYLKVLTSELQQEMDMMEEEIDRVLHKEEYKELPKPKKNKKPNIKLPKKNHKQNNKVLE